MASQPAASFDSVEFNSFITPIRIFGNRSLEKLYFSSENHNVRDRLAVAVMQEPEVVGHVPNITSVLLFLCFCDETVRPGKLDSQFIVQQL